jgi:SPOR domain
MAVKDRRSGGRNWVPGLFAAFWILLAVFSAAYLFRIVTEPRSQTADSAAANPAATSATSPEPAAPSPTPSSVSADQAEALIQANEAKDKEIGELRASVQSLSGQVTELSNRLKPLEKVLGPVAALPSSTSVTTSPPAPDAMRPAEKPPEPPKPSVTAAPPPPPVEAKPEKPVAQAPDDVRPAPKPAETSSDQDASDTPPSPVTADEPPDESTQTANLTPPSIPPGTTRFGIEIGSVGKQDDVRPMWRNLLTNHAALVAGLQARRVMAPDKKWRLIAGPFSSAAEAMQACGLFKKADMPCEATVFAGDAF